MNRKRCVAGAVMIIALVSQCTPGAEKKFNSGRELYSSGSIGEAVKEFEAGIAEFISKRTFSKAGIASCDNAFYTRDGEVVKIIYPVKIKIMAGGDYKLISFDPALNRTALSNGTGIHIFDAGGSPVKIISPLENEKDTVKSLMISGENVIYIINKTIYKCDIITWKASILTADKFHCPFDDPYHSVKFYLSGNLLAVVIGNAGVYSLSVIDTARNIVMLKNAEIASSKLFFNGDDIYHIKGKPGGWTLDHFSIKTGKNIRILTLGDIADAEFSGSGILYESKDGIRFFKYGSDIPVKLPFGFELAGGSGGYPLLKYGTEFIVADMNIFQEKIELLKSIAPGIFNQQQ